MIAVDPLLTDPGPLADLERGNGEDDGGAVKTDPMLLPDIEGGEDTIAAYVILPGVSPVPELVVDNPS